ncbi:hypothetical protein [Aurantiacibacter suaedae]|uniref:hypothetical protein n=1 Tax=Aurantiacibacter suaedae TaxID=2545755 RepID=UPI0010F9DBED|nr:hypothetical protein [Aurantiacibacter suaedae]
MPGAGSLNARLRARLPENLSHRAIALIVTIGIELLILLVLLSLGMGITQPASQGSIISTFDASAPQSENSEPEEQTESADTNEPATPTVPTEQAPAPNPLTPPTIVIPRENTVPVPPPVPQPSAAPEPEPSPRPSSSIRAVIREDGGKMGPPGGAPRGSPDSEIVGRAPDGSPLYAAQWYREPYPSELSGYLSTARPPGWGLIACKTAPQWRVEDCQIVGESPQGSNIARSVLAASWQFLVRPPRVDGEYQVGSWVRIRIDYSRVASR